MVGKGLVELFEGFMGWTRGPLQFLFILNSITWSSLSWNFAVRAEVI